MWFDPDELLKTKNSPPANFANPANCEAKNTQTPPPISKLAELAELAAPLDSGIIVTCYTPNGHVLEVTARSPEHAEFLRRMNPKPINDDVEVF